MKWPPSAHWHPLPCHQTIVRHEVAPAKPIAFVQAELVVLIPARNEERTIAQVVGDFRVAAAQFGLGSMVIVVSDRSTDSTAMNAQCAGASTIEIGHPGGLAEAFRVGVRAGLDLGAKYIVHVDADGQYDAADMPALVEGLMSGADLVIGNRLWHWPEGMSRARYLANRLFSRVVAALSGAHTSDTQSGYRAFTRDVAEAAIIRSTYTYTQEQIIRAHRLGFMIQQVPVAFSPRRFGNSRLVSSVPVYSWRVITSVWAALWSEP